MIFKIITPENIIFDNSKIKSITVTTLSGVITILDNHEPLISVLKNGEIIIRDENNKESIITVSSGFIEVRPKEFSDNKFEVIILTEESVHIKDLDIEKIEAAKKRAEEALKQKDEIDFGRLEGLIDRELSKMKIFNKYRPGK